MRIQREITIAYEKPLPTWGTHKTGSTSIQHYLNENRDALLTQGFYYPCEGNYYFHGERSQSLLAHGLLGQPPKYLGDRIVLDRDKSISDIRRDISASDRQTVIVSSEHFSLAANEDQWRSIRQVFMPVVDSIRIVIYLRRQDIKLESLWAQSVKSGLITDSFEEFRKHNTGQDYFSLLQVLSEVFGKSNIIVRPFERQQLYQGDVVADFTKLIGIKLEEHARDPAKLNQAPTIQRLEAIRLINSHCNFFEQRQFVSRILQSLALKEDQIEYSLLTIADRRHFLDAFRESNSLVAKEFLDRADGILFQEPEEPMRQSILD